MEFCKESTWQRLASRKSITIAEALLLATDIEPTEGSLQLLRVALVDPLDRAFRTDTRESALKQLEAHAGHEKCAFLLALHRACAEATWASANPRLETYTDETLINQGSMGQRSGLFFDCHVRPTHFALHCHSMGWPVPLGLGRLIKPSDRASKAADALVWPWGRYETEMLRHLHAAVLRWWIRYDSTDPTSAHTQLEVRDWLVKERGLSKKKAEAIAAIIHTDDPLPKGPRGRKFAGGHIKKSSP
jgi:hypothetical protein